jgi:hypothetical protein
MTTVETRKDSDVTETTAQPWWRRKTSIAALAVAALFGLGCAAAGDVVSYDVPPESGRYKFQSETNGVKTEWEYISSKPAAGDVPEQQPCMGTAIGVGKDDACRPEPLIFLRYDLGLALDNTAKANGTHHITITGYYQDRLSNPPTVTRMQVEFSFDGGTTWTAAVVEPSGRNTFVAKIAHPGKDKVPGAVALRVSAADNAGDTVKQTMPAAYRLS